MLDLWYKSAIFYCLDVETFMDSDGDGVGDFEGLTQRLDYLNGLGISCIWLLPFYPSPNLDNGYDVTDYYNVDPRLGTLGDFVQFARLAGDRGIRIIVDLVVNHTSDQHPWFQSACQGKESKYHDFYLWSEERPENHAENIMFPGVQESNWTYNEQVGAYYFHTFYKHQPDLNIANPKVQEEIQKIMGFWLELGVSGFRLDAASHLIELRGTDGDGSTSSDHHRYLKELRNFLSWRRGDAIMLAEANIAPDKLHEYFGDGDRMQMVFNFIANQHLFLSMAQQDATPLTEAMKSLPEQPDIGQWANFIRNHDELTLDKLSDEEQEIIAKEFAPDRDTMWIYDRGIRRRFAPMVDGDQRRLRLAYSLALTLPGTPVINYGEEIGMGDDLSLEERYSARTPMQWSNEPNAGFSTANPDELVRPVITEGDYGYKQLNVVDQRNDPHSLLSWMEHAIRVRRECSEFGWGEWTILETSHPAVFAHCCHWRNGTVMAVHNLSEESCTVTLNLQNMDNEHLTEVMGDGNYDPVEGKPPYEIPLRGYGYRWFRVGPYHL